MGTFKPSYPFYWKKMAEKNKQTNIGEYGESYVQGSS